MDWVWKTIIIYFIGTLFVQPIANEDLIRTFGSSLILIVLMIISEYIETKLDIFETIFEGKAVIVIENGKPNLKNLKKLRMSVDLLEAKLRQSGISSIANIKYATIESTGQLGYELIDAKKPITKEELNILMNEILQIKHSL